MKRRYPRKEFVAESLKVSEKSKKQNLSNVEEIGKEVKQKYVELVTNNKHENEKLNAIAKRKMKRKRNQKQPSKKKEQQMPPSNNAKEIEDDVVIVSYSSRNGTFTCEHCKSELSNSERKQHLCSVLHLFNSQEKPTHVYTIPPTNVGYQLLKQIGWEEDKGLGTKEEGRLEPISARTTKLNREGLGSEKVKTLKHNTESMQNEIPSKKQIQKQHQQEKAKEYLLRSIVYEE